MTVKQLIARLKNMPQDLEVGASDHNTENDGITVWVKCVELKNGDPDNETHCGLEKFVLLS